MEGFFSLLFIVGIIIVVCYYKNKVKDEKIKQEEIERLKVEEDSNKAKELLKEKWDEKKTELSTNGLPILNVETLKLTKNELCHFMGDSYWEGEEPFSPLITVRVYDEGLYFENDAQLIAETYGARIISYEYDEPIENTFS